MSCVVEQGNNAMPPHNTWPDGRCRQWHYRYSGSDSFTTFIATSYV